MKLLYYLAAIGGPRLEDKLKILTRNLIYINHTLKQNFSIVINCYSEAHIISKFIKKFSFLDAIYFHYKPKAVLTELWFTNPYTKHFNIYDEIIFILDDVSIHKVNIQKLVSIRKKYNIDLISPAIIGASHNYMNSLPPNKLAFTNSLEIYCMVVTPNGFKKYLSVNSLQNKWIWGVDFLFGYFNIKTAVYYAMNAYHLIPSTSYGGHGKDNEAIKLMNIFLSKHGFSSLAKVKAKYPPIIKTITVA